MSIVTGIGEGGIVSRGASPRQLQGASVRSPGTRAALTTTRAASEVPRTLTDKMAALERALDLQVNGFN